MHRWLRIGIIALLLAPVVTWAGSGYGVSAQGTIYTDTMDSSTTPLLSTESPDVSKYLYSYQNNQFIIQTLQPGFSGDLFAFTSVPDLTDSSVAVDFAIAGDLTGKYAFVGCRGGDQNTGYTFEAHPDTGDVALWRYDAQSAALLGQTNNTTAVNVGSGNNRIEIQCVGNTITGIANGQQLLTAQDLTYASGSSFIGTGKSNATTGQLLTGFDNLTITDLGGNAAQPVQPTQAPLRPTQETGFPTAIPAQPAAPTTEGTTPITDPRVDPDGTLSDAFIISLMEQPVAGPFSASGDLSTGTFKYLSSGVNLSDFYTELTFITPPAAPAGSWTVGFTFWDDGQGNSYDMFIQAKNGAAKWGFGQSSGNQYNLLQSGDLAAGAVDFTPGAENFLSMAVYQGVVILSGNDFELGPTYDLGASTGIGDVQAEVGFLATDTTTTQTLPVALSKFSVWDLSAGVVTSLGTETTVVAEPTQASAFPTAIPMQPTQAAIPTVAPPPASTGNTSNALLQQDFDRLKSRATAAAPIFTSASGILTQHADSFAIVSAGASVADVYVTATFVNPADMATVSDYGIGIRDLNTNQEYRFVVGSDGIWTLSIGSAAPVAQGNAAVNSVPGASNTLELLAMGGTGIIAVNGQALQQVDLSANIGVGDVYIASGMVPSATVDQRQVSYSNFVVYQLAA